MVKLPQKTSQSVPFFILALLVIGTFIGYFLLSMDNIAYAQSLSGCAPINIGNPGANVTIPAQCNTGGSGGLTNPFPDGWQPNRLDMGYDGTFTTKIVAPFSGTIIYAANSFSNWGGYIEIKADQTPSGLPTSTLYFAEGVGVVVGAGTHVTAGQEIAKPVPSVWNGILGNIEWGIAQEGPVGSPTNTYVYGKCGSAGAKSDVLNFASWAEKSLHVAPPSQTSNAGCP